MSLRARLAVLIAVTLVLALGAVFLVTYRGTGDEVRRQIDRDLVQDETSFDLQGVPLDAASPREVAAAAREYVDALPSFGPGARLFVVRVLGGPVVTNEPELLGLARPVAGESPAEARRRAADARTLRFLEPGFRTVSTAGAGDIRTLVAPLQRAGRTVAFTLIGEPVAAVDRAQAGVARTFLLAGAVALVLAALAGFLVASRTSRPLRRMARVAADIDAGRLSQRMRERGRRDEVRVLSDAFDRMLDRLEDAFARQKRFVADASHELRTPLTIVRGQLEVLAREPDPTRADVRRVEGVVRTELVRMQRLVEDLLLLARADEGQLVRPRPEDVEALVLDAWKPLTPTADRRWVLGGLPAGEVRADADRIAQVVKNLVANAVEHTAEGGLVRLAVETREDELEVAVEDDGPGIPPEQRDRVFDRFHRTDPARSRRAGGAGLGLAIARVIVEAHGGSMRAGSSPEGGARVAFTLPGFRAEAVHAAAPPAPVRA